MLSSLTRSKRQSDRLLSLADWGPELSTGWDHLRNRKESWGSLGWERWLEAVRSTLLLKTRLTNSRTTFCQGLKISREGAQPAHVWPPWGQNSFLYNLFQFPLLKFAAVCFSSSCSARPSRAWLLSLPEPLVREMTTATGQAFRIS